VLFRSLECHDGVNAPEARYQTPWDRRVGSTGDNRRNHPIGVRYPRMGRARAEVPLRPVAQLPASVLLPNDSVSCLSCHDLYSREDYLLTVPIEGSKLCLTCHAFD